MQSGSGSSRPAGAGRQQNPDDQHSDDGQRSTEAHSSPRPGSTANGTAETAHGHSSDAHDMHSSVHANGQSVVGQAAAEDSQTSASDALSSESEDDSDFSSVDAMPPPESDPYMAENALEVDDDADGPPEASYAASLYPSVPLRYRVERFDSATINSSSRSLYVEDLDYVVENGRRYCGDYTCPNDDLEQDRMRVVHQVFLNIFHFELTSVPLHNPQYILDIGTGTGEWAIGMGEAYPSCEVVGVDISAIQPTAVPHNVFFEVDDCEIDWMRPDNTIDLVHLRDMAGAFSSWDFIYRQAFACLKPGGHIEVLDFPDYATSNASFFDSFPADAQIHVFARAVDEASIKAGRRRGVYHMDEELLRSLGYVDIETHEHAISLNPQNNAVGKLWLISCLHSVEAISLRLLTKHLGWEPASVFELCEQVCQEIKTRALEPDAANPLSISLRVLTARKPTAAELAASGVPACSSFLTVPTENGHFTDHSEDESTIGGT